MGNGKGEVGIGIMNGSTIATSLMVGLITVTRVPGSFGQEPKRATGQTHHFQPTQYYRTFSYEHPPALRIRPGDRVVTRTMIPAGGTKTTTG